LVAPVEGGEACGYSELGQSATEFDVRRLTGIWFLVAKATRYPGVSIEAAVSSVDVGNNTVNFTFSMFDR